MSPHSDRVDVVLAREDYQALLRESRRNVTLAYVGGVIASWAAVVLFLAESTVTLWVGLFAIVGAVLLAWGFVTSRRLARRDGRPGSARPLGTGDSVDRQPSPARESHPAAFPPDAGGGPGI